MELLIILVLLLPLLLIGGFFLYGILTYNRLVRARNQLREAWSGIDVQLKKRHELVPNLVSVVKGYQKHESELLTQITEDRARAQGAAAVAGNSPTAEAAAAEGAVSRDLGKIMMLAEDYPDLKADASFRDLGKQLVEIEDALQYARRYYNGSARDLNNLVEAFPAVLIAKPTGFSQADFFEIEEATMRLPPDLKDTFGVTAS